MAGTKEGGQKARDTNIAKYGKNFYVRVGAIGGKACTPSKGFGSNPERAVLAGRIGGQISRRGPSKKTGEKNV